MFAILIVLMQRPSESGMGGAFGGETLESVFGGGAGGVLARGTVRAIIAFFLLSLLLAMAHIYRSQSPKTLTGAQLPRVPSVENVAEEQP